jgi:hypothetical protein
MPNPMISRSTPVTQCWVAAVRGIIIVGVVVVLVLVVLLLIINAAVYKSLTHRREVGLAREHLLPAPTHDLLPPALQPRAQRHAHQPRPLQPLLRLRLRLRAPRGSSQLAPVARRLPRRVRSTLNCLETGRIHDGNAPLTTQRCCSRASRACTSMPARRAPQASERRRAELATERGRRCVSVSMLMLRCT